MAQSSFPFENVDTSETQFSQMFRNFASGINGTPTGTELKVTAGTGLQVAVALGQAMVRGHYYISTASENLTITAANVTNPRIDSIVLTLDPTANSIVLAVVTGTAAVSPVAPTLTQTDAGIFQYRLANVAVAAGAGAVGTITDTRNFFGSRFGIWSTAGRPTSPTTGTAGYNSTLGYPEYWTGSAWSSFSAAPTSIASGIITTVVSDKSTAYTIVAGDKNTFIRSTSATAVTMTIANVLAVGESVTFVQYGAGQITFAAGAGVTLTSYNNALKTAGQHGTASVVCVAAGLYALAGNLAV